MLRETQSGAEFFCPDIPCHFPATVPMSAPHPVMEEAMCSGLRKGNVSSYLDFFFSSQVS